jgi:5-methylcytosine-specific restriction protein A
MPRAMKTCSTPRCPNLVTAGRCATCTTAAEQARGNATSRGYGGRHRRHFRRGVLRRDPLCVCVDQAHGHGPQCLVPSTVADHWPHDRRELVRLGLDPDDPQHGRGLCATCHNQHTSRAQPGGWHAP